MRITNNRNLPEPILADVNRFLTEYSPGKGDWTTTQITSPPQITLLKIRHDKDLVVDASQFIWMLLGSAVHYMISRARGEHDLQETRLYMPVNGHKISGQIDNYDMKRGILTDYKITTMYQVAAGKINPDWVAQLNIYAELVRQNGGHVGKLQVMAILRDWSIRKAKQNKDIPDDQAVMVELPMWTPGKVLSYVAERVDDLSADVPRECTEEERWARPDTWAVIKSGRKSALRVMDTEEAAEAWMQMYLASNANKLKPGESMRLSIEFRPGESVRCEDYCIVKDFCPQYKRMLAAKGGEQDDERLKETA